MTDDLRVWLFLIRRAIKQGPSKPRVLPSEKAPEVFNKLTDVSAYTGTHKVTPSILAVYP